MVGGGHNDWLNELSRIRYNNKTHKSIIDLPILELHLYVAIHAPSYKEPKQAVPYIG